MPVIILILSLIDMVVILNYLQMVFALNFARKKNALFYSYSLALSQRENIHFYY
jgi:hypothetical protein